MGPQGSVKFLVARKPGALRNRMLNTARNAFLPLKASHWAAPCTSSIHYTSSAKSTELGTGTEDMGKRKSQAVACYLVSSCLRPKCIK
jgi:hypothetical protein